MNRSIREHKTPSEVAYVHSPEFQMAGFFIRIIRTTISSKDMELRFPKRKSVHAETKNSSRTNARILLFVGNWYVSCAF